MHLPFTWNPFFVTLLKVEASLGYHLTLLHGATNDTSFPSACFAGKCVWKSEVEGPGQEETVTAPSNRSASGTPIHWRQAPPLGLGWTFTHQRCMIKLILYPHFLNNDNITSDR